MGRLEPSESLELEPEEEEEDDDDDDDEEEELDEEEEEELRRSFAGCRAPVEAGGSPPSGWDTPGTGTESMPLWSPAEDVVFATDPEERD